MMTEPIRNTLNRDAIAEEYRIAAADGELRRISDDGEADSAAGRAAHRFAAALGMSRLFGVELNEPAPPLAPAIALAAMKSAASSAASYRDKALFFVERWDKPGPFAEIESLCQRLIESRENLLAVEIAAREACGEAESSGGPWSGPLEASWERLYAVIDDGDRALEENLDVLAAVADFDDLEARRSALAGEFRDYPPWWLDGRVEEEAERIRKDAIGTMPEEATWRAALQDELERLRKMEEETEHVVYPLWSWFPERFRIAADSKAEAGVSKSAQWVSPDGIGKAYAFPWSVSGTIVRIKVLKDESGTGLPRNSDVRLGDVRGDIAKDGFIEFDAVALWRSMEMGLSDELIIDSEIWRRRGGDDQANGAEIGDDEDHRQ